MLKDFEQESIAMSTFQELQNKISNVFGVSSSEYTDEIKRAINESIFEIDSELPMSPHLQATSTAATTTVGTITVTSGIPSDFDHILNLYLTDPSDNESRFPLIFLDRKRWNEERLFDRDNSRPTHYNIWNATLQVGPPPDQAYPVTMDYFKYSTELSNPTDTTSITSSYPRWEHVIIKGAVAKIHRFQRTDNQMIVTTEADYRSSLARFKAWVRRNFDKAPEATRIRGWKENYNHRNPVLDIITNQV